MIHYDEGDWHLRFIFAASGSVIPKALFWAVPSALFAMILTYFEETVARPLRGNGQGSGYMVEPQVWAAVSGMAGVLLAFRAIQALNRFWEATGLLHKMRGEWWQGTSCLMAWSRPALKTKPAEVAVFRHTLVRLTSLMHGLALHDIKSDSNEAFEVLDFYGLDAATRSYLGFCLGKKWEIVYVVAHMVQVMIVKAQRDKVITAAPPVLTRVFQQISRGLVNLQDAKKIADTQFPFPYPQIISILLLFVTVLTPVLVSSVVDTYWWAGIITFIPILGMYSINLAAAELEMPFGDDLNDLPLAYFQMEMNQSLLMLMHTSSDKVPRTSKLAVRTYLDLRARRSKCDLDGMVEADHVKEGEENLKAPHSSDVDFADGMPSETDRDPPAQVTEDTDGPAVAEAITQTDDDARARTEADTQTEDHRCAPQIGNCSCAAGCGS